jgi:hypothetical protein
MLCLVVYAVHRSRVVDRRSRYIPLLTRGSKWFKCINGDVGITGDPAGQLGESGEYKMGRLRVV